MFIKGLPGAGPGLEFRVWSALDGELPADLHECDAWLITGSRHDAYSDIPWIRALRDWIRRAHAADVKLAGVCFGQVIAQALGVVMKSTKGWGWGIGPSHAGAATLDGAGARDHRIWPATRIRWAAAAGATRLAGNDFVPISCFCRVTT